MLSEMFEPWGDEEEDTVSSLGAGASALAVSDPTEHLAALVHSERGRVLLVAAAKELQDALPDDDNGMPVIVPAGQEEGPGDGAEEGDGEGEKVATIGSTGELYSNKSEPRQRPAHPHTRPPCCPPSVPPTTSHLTFTLYPCACVPGTGVDLLPLGCARLACVWML
jgi:hypothetical protein